MTGDRCTVDGVPVKLGDRVWFWHCCRVYQRALHRTDLGMWWEPKTSNQIYSTERAALDAAITDERIALNRAKRDVLRTSRSIERLSARLRGVQ